MIKGVEELAHYLVNEIQDVYRLQGVTINDKHIEVIVRQMLQKTEVNDPGDTGFLKGEHVDRIDFEDANIAIEAQAASQPPVSRCCSASPRRACRPAPSSRRPPSRRSTCVLTDAAVLGKTDVLEGLKENVIVGKPIGRHRRRSRGSPRSLPTGMS